MERYAPQTGQERFLDLVPDRPSAAPANWDLLLFWLLIMTLCDRRIKEEHPLERNGRNRTVRGDISGAGGNYDMIAANLISGTLIELAGEIAARLRTSGIAILSGILAGQDDEVADAMKLAGLSALNVCLTGNGFRLRAGARSRSLGFPRPCGRPGLPAGEMVIMGHNDERDPLFSVQFFQSSCTASPV